MTDGVPKNTGNAYLIKGASLPDSYAAFKAAIEAGTQGLDLNFNSAGWQVIGSLLSKANLLSDATAAKFFSSVTGAETIDQVLAKLGAAALTDGTSLTDIWGHEVPQAYGKIISITTTAAATQVDLDVSQIDFTRYHKIELFVDCPSLTGDFTVRVNGDSSNTYLYWDISGKGSASPSYTSSLATFKEYSSAVLLFYTPVAAGQVGCVFISSTSTRYSGLQTLAATTWDALTAFNLISSQAFPVGTKIQIFGVRK